MYTETTRGITVTVQPVYLEDQSAPTQGHYVWAYRVRIENRSTDTVQLMRRHWKITDAMGRL
ncbi:MAG: ApaG domain, partial [Magnetospirillum sp.]|nr:ApaG domain [Magnetospirillum sp.]